jgi:biopolymer transport protein ExbD
MKLESTLPEEPGFLHAVPLLNLFGLLWIFQLLGPAFYAQSGVAVEEPPSRFQMERFEDPLVITVAAGDQPAVFVGHERVELEQLARKLEAERGLGEAGARMAVLRVDGRVPALVEREIAEIALARGYRVVLAGRTGGELPPRKPGTGDGG